MIKYKSLLDIEGLQVVWLPPLQKETPFRSVSKTTDGHTWVRLGRVLMTDCDCMDVATGEPRG